MMDWIRKGPWWGKGLLVLGALSAVGIVFYAVMFVILIIALSQGTFG